MPQRSNAQRTSERTSEDYAHQIVSEIENYTKHEDFRKKAKEIFNDCIETVAFKNKIKEYAGESFNDRLFKNGWAIILFLGSLVVAGIVGRLIK